MRIEGKIITINVHSFMVKEENNKKKKLYLYICINLLPVRDQTQQTITVSR